jgi:hypothetical protein
MGEERNRLSLTEIHPIFLDNIVLKLFRFQKCTQQLECIISINPTADTSGRLSKESAKNDYLEHLVTTTQRQIQKLKIPEGAGMGVK